MYGVDNMYIPGTQMTSIFEGQPPSIPGNCIYTYNYFFCKYIVNHLGRFGGYM